MSSHSKADWLLQAYKTWFLNEKLIIKLRKTTLIHYVKMMCKLHYYYRYFNIEIQIDAKANPDIKKKKNTHRQILLHLHKHTISL